MNDLVVSQGPRGTIRAMWRLTAPFVPLLQLGCIAFGLVGSALGWGIVAVAVMGVSPVAAVFGAVSYGQSRGLRFATSMGFPARRILALSAIGHHVVPLLFFVVCMALALTAGSWEMSSLDGAQKQKLFFVVAGVALLPLSLVVELGGVLSTIRGTGRWWCSSTTTLASTFAWVFTVWQGAIGGALLASTEGLLGSWTLDGTVLAAGGLAATLTLSGALAWAINARARRDLTP